MVDLNQHLNQHQSTMVDLSQPRQTMVESISSKTFRHKAWITIRRRLFLETISKQGK
jgi:hypothetical protein